MKTFVRLFLATLLLGCCWARNNDLPQGLIPDDYNKNAMPVDKSGMVQVKVSATILAVRDFDPASLEVTADLQMSESWLDSRLNASNVTITSGQHAVWTPDLRFPNAIKLYYPGDHYDQIMIGINGSITFDQKVLVRVPCKTYLTRFPYDEPHCNITVEPSVYRSDRVNLTWEKPVTMAEDIRSQAAPDMILKSVNGSGVNGNVTKSRLVITMDFSRAYGFYVQTVFLPVAIFTLIACLSFLLDSQEPMPRILLITMMMMCLINISQKVRVDLPKASYCTGLDVWTGACFTFMTIAMIETVLVKKFGGSSGQSSGEEGGGEESKSGAQGAMQKMAKWGDRILIIAYPIGFVVFSAIYCAVYLS